MFRRNTKPYKPAQPTQYNVCPPALLKPLQRPCRWRTAWCRPLQVGRAARGARRICLWRNNKAEHQGKGGTTRHHTTSHQHAEAATTRHQGGTTTARKETLRRKVEEEIWTPGDRGHHFDCIQQNKFHS